MVCKPILMNFSSADDKHDFTDVDDKDESCPSSNDEFDSYDDDDAPSQRDKNSIRSINKTKSEFKKI